MRGAIHAVTIQHWGTSAPDAEGRGGSALLSSTSVKGRVVFLSAVETKVTGRYAENVNAVFICPLGTPCHVSDTILVAGIDAALDNTYDVQDVLFTETHLEIRMRVRGKAI